MKVRSASLEAALPMKVETPAYARMLGCTARSIVQLIERGLPAKKKGAAWEVNVDQADRWVQQHAPRIWNRTNGTAPGESPRSKGSSGRGTGRRRRRGSRPPPAAGRNGDLESEDERLRRLDAVLAKFIEQLEGDDGQPGRPRGQQISTECPPPGTDRRRDRVD